ncbi:DUF58 domain-containing protein [Agrococcus sp. SGAir0287]|uniref:DUF58 domain-containing protein n=1 Tax=Agrococcus sp. SGAir0287 TaxID=2070347 RepID=UPI0010CD2D72|nr:DUF58 domain-containing protein [Agrococcus sp. SGAir0287]QCR19669.1 hypothetical protein C1N71_09750 [Agrococcus sp. SGAir0287]
MIELLRRSTRVVTGWGWTLVGVAIVGGPVGVALGWVELVVAASGALLLVLAALPWVLGQRDVDVQLALSAERVPVGQPAHATLVVRRPGRFFAPRAIDVLVGDVVYRLDLPRLDTGEDSTQRIVLDTRRRGRVVVGPATVLRTDPFGILERTHVLTAASELVVHPRVARIPSVAAGLVRDLEGETSAELTADDVAFHSLRDYHPGDEPRHVHWRSTARTGQLLVRQFEPSKRSDTLVCVSTSAEDYGADDFELALEVVATIASAAIAQRRSVRVVESPSSGRLDPATVDARTRDRLLDALTDLATDRRLGIVDVVRSIALAPQASVAWIVVGGTAAPRRLREATGLLPPDVAPIVLRADALAPPSVGRLGRVPVLTVGLLEDLPRGLRSEALA